MLLVLDLRYVVQRDVDWWSVRSDVTQNFYGWLVAPIQEVHDSIEIAIRDSDIVPARWWIDGSG
jgi:hypothetical protein